MSFSFFLKLNDKVNKIILSQGIFMINMKALGLIDQKLLARLQFSKIGQDHRVKMLLPVERSCQKKLMRNTKALAFTDQKLLARLKF